ncbi:MAG: hypothetical protein JOY68_02010, partial [Candidatus Dormibacteraeota bacterium]|nr:hypothetical protein [Candidatus Dormibacteraeota bacterium]
MAIAGLLVAGAANIAVSAGATAASPTISLSPATGVTDGQFVQVSITGVSRNGPGALDLLECTTGATTVLTQCAALNQQATIFLDNAGDGVSYFPLYSGADPNLVTSQTPPVPLTCDSNNPCEVATAVTQSGRLSFYAAFGQALGAQLKFGPTPDNCPAVVSTVTGGGSAAANRAMYQWEATVCQPPYNLPLGYTQGVQGDPGGVNSFIHGVASYGVTGPWAPDYAPP